MDCATSLDVMNQFFVYRAMNLSATYSFCKAYITCLSQNIISCFKFRNGQLYNLPFFLTVQQIVHYIFSIIISYRHHNSLHEYRISSLVVLQWLKEFLFTYLNTFLASLSLQSFEERIGTKILDRIRIRVVL